MDKDIVSKGKNLTSVSNKYIFRKVDLHLSKNRQHAALQTSDKSSQSYGLHSKHLHYSPTLGWPQT